jgi:hypothetical protein
MNPQSSLLLPDELSATKLTIDTIVKLRFTLNM